MTPERWKQIEDVFQAAIDLPEDERGKFIAEACADDLDLRKQVEVLVSQHDEAGNFIEEPAFAITDFNPTSESGVPTLATDTFDDPAIGRNVGAYRIVREIGRGGMGAVYLAERADSEFRRRVAIFEQERAFAGDTPTTRAKHAHVLAACERFDESREILRDLITWRDEQWVTAYEIAVIYALLDESDEAFKWLERAGEENAVGFVYVRVDPRINNLRTDPRFDDLVRRVSRRDDEADTA